MRVNPEFIYDETLPPGTRIIESCSKPQVHKDGVLIQKARITVRENNRYSEEREREIERKVEEALRKAREKGFMGGKKAEPSDSGTGATSDSGHGGEVEPTGYGDFGPIFTQYKGDAKGAIQKLIELQSGEAIGALHHKDVGDIDLVWGIEGTGYSDGMGLAKLVKYQPEVVERLQEILDDMVVVKRTDNRINL